ncbi:ceramidase [Xylariales sp. PMI_506]|nr:ceramidase [Xylariales sp. PMI_506]
MGHHNLHFSGDPHALSGAWSPPTSAANFCEEDYAVTRYLAEFVNALTNLAYVYFALRYMYGPGSRGLLSPKLDSMSASLLVLGIASFLFHASLRQTLQFADELSMIGLCWSFLQGTLTVRQPQTRAQLITAVMSIVLCLLSAFYVWTANILFHVIAFTSMLVLVAIRSQYLFHRASPPFSDSKRHDWSRRTWASIFICLFGYLLWNIDLEFCTQMRELRSQIGLPWAWLLEFHGWWHVLTAVGASHFMDVVREMRDEIKQEKKE